jgi:hypothetical protein
MQYLDLLHLFQARLCRETYWWLLHYTQAVLAFGQALVGRNKLRLVENTYLAGPGME